MPSALSLLVCDNLESFSSGSPFLCMDLSYITALLKDGFGFADSTLLQVRGRALQLGSTCSVIRAADVLVWAVAWVPC